MSVHPHPKEAMTEEKEEEVAVREGLVDRNNEDTGTTNTKGAVNGYPHGRPDTLLETPAERRGRRISHLVVYTTTFVMSVGFSIVLTGVWPYLKMLEPGVSKQVLGWVIAANPLGQMIASPLMGLWGNRAGSNRGAFLVSVFMSCIGHALYAVLSVFGSAALTVMIISRFITGVSSGNIAIIRAYISSSTTLRERTTAISLTSAAQAIGFIIGPAIQAALAVAFSHEKSVAATNTTTALLLQEGAAQGAEEGVAATLGIQWNMYTACGWIGVFIGLCNFILFLPCIYKEYHIATKEAHLQRHAANEGTSKLPKPDYIALGGILITFFISVMIYVLLEAIMVPMCMDLYAWTDEDAVLIVGIALCIGAFVCLVVFLSVGRIVKVVEERIVFIVGGVVLMLLGLVLFIPMGNTYPKIKNCTSTSHFNESQDVIYPHKSTFPPYLFNDSDVSAMNLRNGSVDGADESDTFTFTNAQDNDSFTRTLRRQRRHVASDDYCEDTGCPPEQEWCFDTPIIELPQLGVASLISITGYPVAFSISSALFSKVLGPKPQGVWMGILTSTGSFSRVVGPILVSYAYTELGTRWTFSLLAAAMFLTLILDLVLYKRLVPMNVVKRRKEDVP